MYQDQELQNTPVNGVKPPTNPKEIYFDSLLTAYNTSLQTSAGVRILIRDLMPLGNEVSPDELHDLVNSLVYLENINRKLTSIINIQARQGKQVGGNQ